MFRKFFCIFTAAVFFTSSIILYQQWRIQESYYFHFGIDRFIKNGIISDDLPRYDEREAGAKKQAMKMPAQRTALKESQITENRKPRRKSFHAHHSFKNNMKREPYQTFRPYKRGKYFLGIYIDENGTKKLMLRRWFL